jgi:hypothetical protein
MVKENTLVAPKQSVLGRIETGLKSDVPCASRQVKETVC